MIDTERTDALRTAFRRHRADVEHGAFTGCTPTCSGATYARIEPEPPWSEERMRHAWQDHWEKVPDWVWTTHSIQDTDHRCSEACLDDIASRL
jgi:hypothetical protein